MRLAVFLGFSRFGGRTDRSWIFIRSRAFIGIELGLFMVLGDVRVGKGTFVLRRVRRVRNEVGSCFGFIDVSIRIWVSILEGYFYIEMFGRASGGGIYS